ncbi:cnn1p [Saccharomyces arboricola H-6]|uniref:Cnn1p n=1 Tax=Saccharomyces arboricola (strain H-6 / AS 2.3317 / CBS 10644) TaxID=1160507 RepID=J8Q5G9_SACAR|nr:cnn1p [Saccharomyces arboricola H-6]
MSTPRKTPTDSGDTEVSEIRTPFRERALEEQRLKDEILIRSTPGYRKLLSTSAQPHDILNKDPNELRSFLQDLSQVLARKSQGGDTNANESRARNLIDELTYEENRIEETESLQSGNSKDADENIDDETQTAGYTSLSQTVFAQLHERDKGLKSRKVDPIVIQDAPMAEEEDSVVSSSKSASNVSMDVLETLVGRGRDVAEESSIHGSDSFLIMEQEEEASEPLTMDREEEEEEEEKEHSQTDENSEVLGDMRNDPVHLNIPVARHAPVKPLQIADLKHLTRQFLNENEIILPKQTWLAIQEESLHIMNFLDKKIGTLQKQSLVDSFIDMGIIHNVDDMFELVHELLPLEHQSRIETYLF